MKISNRKFEDLWLGFLIWENKLKSIRFNFLKDCDFLFVWVVNLVGYIGLEKNYYYFFNIFKNVFVFKF